MKINQWTIIGLCLFTLQAYAGQDRGGGSYVVIDGKVTIADPYYAGRSANQVDKITLITYKDFPEKVRAYIDQSQRLFRNLLRPAMLDFFFNDYVRNEKQRYYLVPKSREKNVPCERYLPILNRKVDEHFQVGCTFGLDTYLFVDKWSQAPIEEQALALIHERLWAWTEDRHNNIDQKIIADFITWAQVLENRYVNQELKNDRSLMPPAEIKGMRVFFKAAFLLGFDYEEAFYDYSIVSGGGLIKDKDNITIENSFLGFGTFIFAHNNSEIRIKNSTLLNTILKNTGTKKAIEISDSTTINSDLMVSSFIHSRAIDSLIHNGAFIKDSVFVNSQLNGNGPDVVDLRFNYSNVFNSKMYFGHQSVGILNFTDIVDTYTEGSIFANGLEKSRIKILKTKLSADSTIEAGSIFDKVDILAFGTVHVGSENKLRNIQFQGHGNVDLAIENKINISNGNVSFLHGCLAHVSIKTRSQFYLGRKNEHSEIDLNNTTLNLETRGLSCSTRYAP